MPDINWKEKDGLQAATKYVNKLTKNHTKGVLIFTINQDGTYSTAAFGEVMVSDIAIASLMLQKRALDQICE